MEGSDRSSIFIAPLTITKVASANTNSDGSASPLSLSPERTTTPEHRTTTPPQTPVGHSDTADRHDQYHELRQPLCFHTYLRAHCLFHPAVDKASPTGYLTLDEGDLVFVNSVLPNGWTEGTLVWSGHKGWFPSDYCHGYAPDQMRYLLTALTNVWNLVESDQEQVYVISAHAQSLRAGLQYMLEQTNCLLADDPLVKAHARLRRDRRALAHEITLIDRLSEESQSTVGGEELHEIHWRARTMVALATRFLDAWLEETKQETSKDDEIAATHRSWGAISAPLTSGETSSFSATPEKSEQVTQGQSDARHRGLLSNDDVSATRDDGKTANNGYRRALTFQVRPGTVRSIHPGSMLESAQTRRYSSYRISSARQLANSQPSPWISDRLTSTHDTWASCLGSLISLPLHFRTHAEILVTLQEANSGYQDFLTVVEAIYKRYPSPPIPFEAAYDMMCLKADTWKNFAKNLIRSCVGEDNMPNSGDIDGLRHAAAECIIGAGMCVDQSLLVLERIGDFEFEKPGLRKPAFDSLEFANYNHSERDTGPKRPASTPPQPTYTTPSPPPLVPSTPRPNALESNVDIETGNTELQSHLPGSYTGTLSQSPPHIPNAGRSSGYGADTLVTEPSSGDNSVSRLPHASNVKMDGEDSYRKGSGSTFIGSMRDSERSPQSPSTLATSPDFLALQDDIGSLNQSFSGGCSPVDEEARLLVKTHAHELMFNRDGQITGGSLPALVERLTTNGSTPDAQFVSAFFLTFRSFSTPQRFAWALVNRFNSVSDLAYRFGSSAHIAGPVQIRVFNVFKSWLELHWRMDTDRPALDTIKSFAAETLTAASTTLGKRLMDLALGIAHSDDTPRHVSSIRKTNNCVVSCVVPDDRTPSPIITKSQSASLKKWKYSGACMSVFEFDPLEMARQLTIKSSRMFCAILPEELVAIEEERPNVRAVQKFANDLSHFVTESILQLEDPKKRAKLIKRWVKIATKCLELNNYECVMEIHASLTNTAIYRLAKTWDQVPPKSKAALVNLTDVLGPDRNFSRLRQRLREHTDTCVPFLGMYLTDLKMVHDGNPALRQLPGTGQSFDNPIQIINFDKHMKTAKIISEIQQFQIAYNLKEAPELQDWIQHQLAEVRSTDDTANVTMQKQYRMSLFLEPREEASPAAKGHGTERERNRVQTELERLTKGLRWKRTNHSTE
ncbi:hypothetical protein MMC13_001865 [Lambiella insularis]|nr:hypothetical protein [Lambiella insularis]